MITITRRVLVSAPKESVQMYLRDLRNMAEYGRKVEQIEVSYPEEGSGFVEVQGRFLGLPWSGAFKMDFTRDGGIRGEMVRGPLKRMVSGYHLRPVAGGTLVTQEEQYQFPLLLQPVMKLLKSWFTRNAELELGAIKEGAERLNRQIQLQNIEAVG